MSHSAINTSKKDDAFVVNEYTDSGEKKQSWNRVGYAVPNKDGKGLSFYITPKTTVYGTVVIREREEKPKNETK